MAEHEYFGNSTGQRLLEKLKTALGGKANQSEVARLSKEIADLKSTGIIVVQSGDTLTIESVETENVEEVGSDG